MSSVPHRIKKTVNQSSIFTTFLTMCVLWSFKRSARAFRKTKIKHIPCPTTATANWIQPVYEAASAKITAIVWRRVRFCDSGPFESIIDFCHFILLTIEAFSKSPHQIFKQHDNTMSEDSPAGGVMKLID